MFSVKFDIDTFLLEKNPHNLQFFFNEDSIVSSDETAKSKQKAPKPYTFEYLTTRKEFENRLKIYPKNSFMLKDLYRDLFKIPKKFIYPHTNALCRPKSTLHTEQLKLLIGLMYFLKVYVTPNPKKDTIVIYTGAAPGYNIGFNIFPDFIKKWVLVDPSKTWDSRLHKRPDVKIVQDFFTDEMATALKEEYASCNIVFISDIMISPGEKDESQMRWVNILLPSAYCLKMCLPYPSDQVSGEYLTGDVILQTYAPPSSTESRLMRTRKVPGSKVTTKMYDYTDYANRFFTFNNFIRPCDFSNAINGIDLRDYGYDNCYDCVSFYSLVSLYYNMVSPKEITMKMTAIVKSLNPKGENTVSKDIYEKSKMRFYKTR